MSRTSLAKNAHYCKSLLPHYHGFAILLGVDAAVGCGDTNPNEMNE